MYKCNHNMSALGEHTLLSGVIWSCVCVSIIRAQIACSLFRSTAAVTRQQLQMCSVSLQRGCRVQEVLHLLEASSAMVCSYVPDRTATDTVYYATAVGPNAIHCTSSVDRGTVNARIAP